MSDYGTVLESGAIRFERLLPGPIERVWAYLTDPDRRARWLAAGPMDVRAGGGAELHFDHATLNPPGTPVPESYSRLDSGVRFGVRILRCEAPRLLVMTWPGGVTGPDTESEVTFELAAANGQVRLVLTHRHLARPLFASVAAGWHTHLGILEDVLAGDTPRGFWATHTPLEAEYRLRGAA